MSQQYDNRNKGVLFVEETKKSDNHPDFKGSLTMEDGKEYWVSGWKRMSKDGKKKMISIAIDPKQPRSYQPPPIRQEEPSRGW